MGLPAYNFDQKKFRVLLAEKNWNRNELKRIFNEKSGGSISLRSISSWKSGEYRPAVNTVYILEKVFDVPSGYFLKK